MRLAAQVKGGFYPAHENALELAAGYLQPPVGENFAILDPCAGEGDAIRRLGKLLGCPAAMTYAIELDDSRADAVHAALPDSHVLAPADLFGCKASFGSFSFIWLNPPFDYSYGGCRVEEQFLSKATEWLMPNGVMVLVCPEDVIEEYSHARQHFANFYENVSVVPFPPDHRPFKEVIVFGHKRPRPRVVGTGYGVTRFWESVQAPPGYRYRIPPGNGPRIFQKVEPTEPEMQRMLAASPLRSYLQSPPELPVPSPPLPLGTGHVALLLASGHLDGTVQPQNGPVHVVRGTSRKHSFVSDVTDVDNEDGSTTTRTTISERIELVIRTVDRTGCIRTFSDIEAKTEDNLDDRDIGNAGPEERGDELKSAPSRSRCTVPAGDAVRVVPGSNSAATPLPFMRRKSCCSPWSALKPQPRLSRPGCIRQPAIKNTSNTRFISATSMKSPLIKCPDGYRIYRSKLEYGLWHVLCLAKREGFMPVVSDETVWQLLQSGRFTTPLCEGLDSLASSGNGIARNHCPADAKWLSGWTHARGNRCHRQSGE